jgi:hypothetical protein
MDLCANRKQRETKRLRSNGGQLKNGGPGSRISRQSPGCHCRVGFHSVK